MLHYAIDWCLTPTLVVIQLYRVHYAYLVEHHLNITMT